MSAVQNKRRGREISSLEACDGAEISLPGPTFSQERKGKKKSACFARNEVQERAEGKKREMAA
jgi:hypothetical protein